MLNTLNSKVVIKHNIFTFTQVWLLDTVDNIYYPTVLYFFKWMFLIPIYYCSCKTLNAGPVLLIGYIHIDAACWYFYMDLDSSSSTACYFSGTPVITSD